MVDGETKARVYHRHQKHEEGSVSALGRWLKSQSKVRGGVGGVSGRQGGAETPCLCASVPLCAFVRLSVPVSVRLSVCVE